MVIWVDADACPVPIKEILFRAAGARAGANAAGCEPRAARAGVPVRKGPTGGRGFDVADAQILERLAAGDPWSPRTCRWRQAVAAGAFALNPRGTLYTADNVKDRGAPDFMEGCAPPARSLRPSG
jgi:uncharacterized protein YaiI (UPF0178 family)